MATVVANRTRKTLASQHKLPLVTGASGYRADPLTPYVFLLPALALFAAFSLYPIVQALVWSFTDLTLLAPDQSRWVGMQNYRNAFGDEELVGRWWAIFREPGAWQSVWYSAAGNTLRFGLWFLPPYVIVPLALAAMLDKIDRGQTVLRTVIFIPVIISLAVAAVIWVLIYDQNYGILNLALVHLRELLNGAVGLFRSAEAEPYFTFGRYNWLGDPKLAMPALAIMSFWNGMGLNVLLYMVGLNRIDRDLYEAAHVDGAGPAKQFFAITLPLLRPTVYLVVLLSVIGVSRVFGQMFIMTGGGPANTTQSYVMYVYKVAFGPQRNCEFGYASALAFLMTAVILLLSAASQRFNRSADQD